jgi:hypothetical protein
LPVFLTIIPRFAEKLSGRPRIQALSYPINKARGTLSITSFEANEKNKRYRASYLNGEGNDYGGGL